MGRGPVIPGRLLPSEGLPAVCCPTGNRGSLPALTELSVQTGRDGNYLKWTPQGDKCQDQEKDGGLWEAPNPPPELGAVQDDGRLSFSPDPATLWLCHTGAAS